MTAILALENPANGMICIGCDGRVSGGNSIISESMSKVFPLVRPPGFLAIAGEGRLASLVSQSQEMPEYKDPWDLVGLLRELARRDGWRPGIQNKEEGGPELFPFSGLVAWPEGPLRGVYDFCMGGGVFRIEPGLPSGRGSAGELAAAALLGLVEVAGWPETKEALESLVKTSLQISMRLNNGAGGSVQVFTC